MRKFIAFALLTLATTSSAFAVEPDEVLADSALEARARAISRDLRCVVCQSQNIDDSNAPLAKDMRIVVRERLVSGDTDKEVYQYLVSRYGDYVLLKPPMQSNTIFLWAAPVVIFLIAAAAAGFYLANMKREDDKASDADGAAFEETAA